MYCDDVLKIKVRNQFCKHFLFVSINIGFTCVVPTVLFGIIISGVKKNKHYEKQFR